MNKLEYSRPEEKPRTLADLSKGTIFSQSIDNCVSMVIDFGQLGYILKPEYQDKQFHVDLSDGKVYQTNKTCNSFFLPDSVKISKEKS